MVVPRNQCQGDETFLVFNLKNLGHVWCSCWQVSILLNLIVKKVTLTRSGSHSKNKVQGHKLKEDVLKVKKPSWM